MKHVPVISNFFLHRESLRHQTFLPLLTVTFLIWLIYRTLFAFPIWFDESIGKLVFFGLPVWLYTIIAQTKIIHQTLDVKKLLPGLYLGVAFGGLYAFTGVVLSVLGQSDVQSGWLFFSSAFWSEFLLALMTGFWESLFFFAWVVLIAQKRFPEWSMGRMLAFVTLVFVIFHIPNTLLRFDISLVVPQLLLLTSFALGQSLLFLRYKNVYMLSVSHAIWGMALLVFGSKF